ncbi:MAG: L,D-transpeptidase [Proteobacteria bacterium]|nr:L,D-transpeptidase [Pseudomonadota bacterium]
MTNEPLTTAQDIHGLEGYSGPLDVAASGDEAGRSIVRDTLIRRRTVLKGLGLGALFAAPILSPVMSSTAEARANRPPTPAVPGLDVWSRTSPKPFLTRYTGSEPVGSIMVDLHRKKLYYVKEAGQAVVYTIASPLPGMEPRGRSYTISTIREWPEWRPPQSLLARARDLREALARIGRNYITGGEHNPMGSVALYMINEQGVDEGYRIHGTNDPESIGTRSSIGCVRLHNLDLNAAPNGYIDHEFALLPMIEARGKKIKLTIYRGGEPVPGINLSGTALNP